jgi:flagellar basal-body rod protein FlgG
MVSESIRTNVISNNLANVNTTGYKRDETVNSEFEKALLSRIHDGEEVPKIGELGHGTFVDEIFTEHSQGSFVETGNNLDLAIAGSGYFAIDMPQGVRYTRDGSFVRAGDGTLVTHEGRAVLNQQGQPINIPDGGQISISPDGNIFVDNTPVDTLQFVEFGDERNLRKIGENLYEAANGEQAAQASGTIEQGLLERSNVNVVSEMIKLINAYRAYEANSKSVVTQDSLLDKAVNNVGSAI